MAKSLFSEPLAESQLTVKSEFSGRQNTTSPETVSTEIASGVLLELKFILPFIDSRSIFSAPARKKVMSPETVSVERVSGDSSIVSFNSPLVEFISTFFAAASVHSILPDIVSAEKVVRFPSRFAVMSPEVVSNLAWSIRVTSSNTMLPDMVSTFVFSAVSPVMFTSAETDLV